MTAGAHSRKPYFYAFAVLVLLTIAEVGVVYVPGISKAALVAALILLAIAKAGLVLLYFMHLRDESRGLQLTVLVPFALPALIAFALAGDAAWRFLR